MISLALEAAKITQSKLAALCNCSEKHISEVINEKSGIGYIVACRLQREFAKLNVPVSAEALVVANVRVEMWEYEQRALKRNRAVKKPDSMHTVKKTTNTKRKVKTK